MLVMKRLLLLTLLSAVPALFSSCVTADVMARAEGKPPPRGPQDAPAPPPAPAYYALVPLVLPIDIVFWPIEYFYLKDN
jgi:hypothetical protein